MRGLSHIALALGVTVATVTASRAETYLLDESTGAVYDSVGDGWFFAGTTPPLPPPDGVGDAGGQALAVGLITGVLELRAMAEFPLATLTSLGLTAGQVQGATFTFTIDDVIGTFGPGATFDNTASDPIAVYHYPANGIVTTSDFSPAGATQVGVETQFRWRGVDAFLVLFRHQFHDLIAFSQLRVCTQPGVPPGCVLDPLPELPGRLRFQTQNLARALTQGLELGIDVEPLALLGYETPHQPSVGIGYAYLDSENQNGIPGEDGNELPFRPRNRVLPSVAYRYRPWGFSLRVWGEYESDTFTSVTNDPIDVARNHWLWNFKVQVAPFKVFPEAFGGRAATAIDIARHLEVFVEGDNVFDVEFGPVSGAGRLASPAAYVFGIAGKF